MNLFQTVVSLIIQVLKNISFTICFVVIISSKLLSNTILKFLVKNQLILLKKKIRGKFDFEEDNYRKLMIENSEMNEKILNLTSEVLFQRKLMYILFAMWFVSIIFNIALCFGLFARGFNVIYVCNTCRKEKKEGSIANKNAPNEIPTRKKNIMEDTNISNFDSKV